MPPIVKQGMKLVDSQTGSTINSGAQREDFRGELWYIVGGEPPKHESSTGRVEVTSDLNADWTQNQHYYPSVFGLKWVAK